MTVKWAMNSQALLSNHTETNSQILSKRVAYVAAHREYFVYLHHLLNTAMLPASCVPLPNMTTIAAMVAEMRAMHPTAPWLNGVVLGRVLHKVLPTPLLTWHGGRHGSWHPLSPTRVFVETTAYRVPEIQKAKLAFEHFTGEDLNWCHDHEQWQTTLVCESESQDEPYNRHVAATAELGFNV